MNSHTPKPKPSAKVKVVKKPEPIKEEKKPFVRRPHLMQRPFNDEALFEKLRQQASENSVEPRNPRRAHKKETGK